MHRSREIKVLLEERVQLFEKVEGLTGEIDRLNVELERMKITTVQSTNPSPVLRHASPPSSMLRSPGGSRQSSPVQSAVITELRQLLESNQVTAKRLKDELNQISRKSRDEDSAVAGLQNVYRDLSNCCTELETSLHHSAADVDRLFTPELVSA